MTFLNSETACSKSYEEAASLLGTDLKLGLENHQIPDRRKLYAFNEFEIKKEDPLWQKYIEKVSFYTFNIFSLLPKKHILGLIKIIFDQFWFTNLT